MPRLSKVELEELANEIDLTITEANLLETIRLIESEKAELHWVIRAAPNALHRLRPRARARG